MRESLMRDFRKILIAIGASAGGTRGITSILSSLPDQIPPIVIVEHLWGGGSSESNNLSELYANWLASLCPDHILSLAKNGDKLVPNRVLLVPENNCCLIRSNQSLSVLKRDVTPENPYLPSINLVFSSGAEVYGRNMMGIVLSGLHARDTLEGAKKVKTAGGFIIAEQPSTCKFPAMPEAIIDAGLVDEVAPVQDLPQVMRKLGFLHL